MVSFFLVIAALTPGEEAAPEVRVPHSDASGASLEVLQEATGSEVVVSGSVLDPAGNPAAGIAVELRNSSGDVVNRRYTDSSGSYQVTSHPTGTATGSEIPEKFTLGAIYPNPTGGQSVLPVTISSEDSYRIAIYTVDGRLLMRSEEHFSPGMHQIHISMPRSAGTYLVRVSGGGQSEIRQVTSMSGDGPRLTVVRGPELPSQMLGEDLGQGAMKTQASSDFAWTLRVDGGSAFEDYETVFTQPGVYEYDIALSYRMDNGIAACQDLELVESSSRPARFVQIEGLGEVFGDEPLAWLYDATVDDPGADNRNGIFLERLDEDERESEHEGQFIVPLHPGNNMDGGPAKIVIISEDEQIVCPGIAFDVLPLTPAPGTMQQLVDGLDNAFSEQAEQLGYDPDEFLHTSIAELPVYTRGTAAGLQAVRGPEFDNNLQNLFSGDAPVLGGDVFTEEALEVFDAVVAATGLADLLTEALSINEKAAAVSFSNETAVSRDKEGWDMAQTNPDATQDLIQPSGYMTPVDLNFFMRMQQRYAEKQQGLSGAVVSAASHTLGVLAFASGVTGPDGISAILGFATLSMAVHQLAVDMNRSALPSHLAGIDMEAFPTDYPEDDDSQGDWNATLIAMSEGWTLTWPVLLGNFPGLGKAVDVLRRIDRMKVSELQEWTLGFLQGYLTNIWDVTADSGPLNIDPDTIGVVVDPDRENESRYFTWQLLTLETEDGSDPFSFDELDETKYQPEAVGVSELRIRTTGGDIFQGQDAVNTRLLTLNPISVEIRPEPAGRRLPFHVKTGEELDLLAIVEHANDKSVEWTVYPHTDYIVSGAEMERLKFFAPDEEGTHLVVAASTSRDGLRADNKPPRTATQLVRVTNDQLVIEPVPVCLELDETVQFSASLRRDSLEILEFSALQWSITGPGTLQGNGEFIPQGEGQVTIEFTLRDDPEITAQISFRVSETCSYLVASSGWFDLKSACVNLIEIHQGNLWYLGVGISESFSFFTPISAIITTEGEWAADFPLVDDDAGMTGDYHWWLPGSFVLDDGTQWDFMPDELMNPILTIRREVRTIDGSDVPVYHGTFNAAYYNFTRASTTGELVTTLVSGRFRGVRPGHDGCFE